MPERLPDINLLPKYERENSGGLYLFFVLLIVVLLAYLVTGFVYFTTKNKLESAENKSNELSEKVDELQLQISLQEEGGDSLADSVSFAENRDIQTSTLILELTDLLPDHSYLSDYNYGSQTVNITNQFETLDAVAEYTASLVESNLVRDAKIGSVGTFDLKGEQEDPFTELPRYEADYTLQIQHEKLKGTVNEYE